ncbi:MAG: NADPH:quinone oxidoreductase family protein [Alphaproteobacteria bacterium]|nr:NADPH:quinone oxidoreductase family protein [Alphaproteobacteria bacterium]MCB9929968.1 NADPH:quinone oxidoreductase family protein [Alphaproteobacteria bacterium]
MRAVVVDEFNPFDQLELHDWPSPQVGPRQVKIRTQAIGISFAESLLVSGQYQRRPPLPFVAGCEVAGIVTECGEGATRFRPGDRVCGLIDWGAMAEEAVAPEVSLHRMPDAMSFAEGTTIASSYATTAAAFTWPKLLDVRAGDRVLVHGATGGVGMAAVEIGKILGATVIATAGSEEKLRLARERGADHAINYREHDFRAAVLEITDGRGVDKVYDPVGGDVFAQSLRCMAPEGRICPIGFASGAFPQIPANLLLVKNLTVCGLNLGYYFGWSPDDVRYRYEDLTRGLIGQVFRWFEAGQLKPPIDTVFPLAQFREALARVLARQSIGRVVLAVNEEAARLGVGD